MTPIDDLSRATALVAAGKLADAGKLAELSSDPRMIRILAYVLQQQGKLQEAEAAYGSVLQAIPTDGESFNNLGNVLLGLEQFEKAIAAFKSALRLLPNRIGVVFNLSEALSRGERHAERQAVMRIAASIAGSDTKVQTELGLAEAAMLDFPAAERAFREAIRLDPRNLSAYLELGVLLENLNRIDNLSELADSAEAANLGPEAGFLRAWALRRQGRFAEALAAAALIPDTINPVRSADLLAGLHDRLGHASEAFAAFETMNRASAASSAPPPGPSYRESVTSTARHVSPEWAAGWSVIDVPSTPPAPIFIVGFPRSGTTLLDTLLMNLPMLHVMEEQPVMRDVEAAIALGADIGRMTADEAGFLRARYFASAASASPASPGQTIVDKHPLHMARMPLIHRLFPDAKIILVERHPCDAVLSCFMASFNLNRAMRSFTDLTEAARTYDAVFEAWRRANAAFPLNVHRIRYERMVSDLAGEMRPLLAFLGLPWDDSVLDNQKAAAARGHVHTASYAQVGEPIYKRAAGRWESYRTQMTPVLPILAPWAEAMGYAI